ncbi:MAG: PASTA domain-containing protein [Phycisphaerae bacterium]|nr:PASTA domain-containing protein [Phycisphaerae bacterium]
MKRFVFLGAVIVCLLVNTAFGAGTYDGGNGTAETPYQIATAEQLDSLGQHPEDWAGQTYFVLTADIDLSGYDGLDERPSFNRIGVDSDNYFNGTFDGNGHIISNLTLNLAGHLNVGFFGKIGYTGEVRNLGVVNVRIVGKSLVGAIAGFNGGLIEKCFSDGTINGKYWTRKASSYIGGLVGLNTGTIRQCCSTASVEGGSSVGGLVGYNYYYYTDATIAQCYSCGSVTGDDNLGGLAGENKNSITNCFWDATASGIDDPESGQADTDGMVGLDTNQMQMLSTYTDAGWDFTDTDGDEADWKEASNYYPQLNWVQLQTVMTDAAGMNKASAISSLESEGFEVTVKNFYSNTIAKDIVTSQLPGKNSEIPAGSGITITVSLGRLFSGGDGTADNPYQIATANELHLLSLRSEDWDKCFVLTADIDMDPSVAGNTTYTNSLIGTYHFDGYGNPANQDNDFPFTGTFDGGGHSIKNVVIDAPDERYIGLFGYNYGGVVKNLGVENITIEGYTNVSGLAAYSSGDISKCFVTGSISGYECVGSVAGVNYGKISQSFCSGEVSGAFESGGFVGENRNRIEDCYSASSVRYAGFAGSNYNGEINRCYSIGALSGPSNYFGYIGGFLGKSGDCISCFWDVETSGCNNPGGYYDIPPIGLSTAMMKTMRFFSYHGWDNGAWVIDEGNDYPRLAWEGTAGVPIAEYIMDLNGNGTEAEPYEIATAGDLRLISSDVNFWDKHFRLRTDIDMDGVFTAPIGIDYYDCFTGTFDGDGRVISNLAIESNDDCGGLFGYIGQGSEVKNLGLVNVNVSRSDQECGGLAGYNEGTVSQCYVTGKITSSGDVNSCGGLIGINYGTVSQCYVTGEVTETQQGRNYCGGLIGSNEGFVRDCYSRAGVRGGGSGDNATGGLIGETGGGEITRCYSAGIVSDGESYFGGFVGLHYSGAVIDGCFWDYSIYDKPPWEFTDDDYARTTAEMQNLGIYGFSGWGVDAWTLDVGNDYPRLAWEGTGGVAISDKGDGSVDNPYQLSTALDLLEVNRNRDKSFILIDDIDLDPNVTGRPVYLSPIREFYGIFDGNGHVISNIVIEFQEGIGANVYSGLFGTVGTNGIVKNLGVENVQIKGNDSAGGLVGSLFCGKIRKCYSTGTVSNYKELASGRPGGVGGLVGRNYGGVIRDSYSMCDVSTANGSYVGGVVGKTFPIGAFVPEIRNCYSGGRVSGDIAGGVIGRDSNGIYPNCFWDSSVNPGLSDCGYDIIAEIYDVDLDSVYGVPTGLMQTASAFTDAGWDFVGESVNGDFDIWQMLVDGSWYPRLAWEFSAGDFVGSDGVDMSDLAYFAGRYGADVDIEHADLDGDGVVGVLDLCIFASHWLD